MRIIHFSDFHLDGEHKETAEKIVLRLTNALVGIHSQKPIDLILFTGDMVYKGGKGFTSLTEAFEAFEKIVINKIVEALNLPHNRFIFTLGNHDVDTTLVEKKENNKLKKSLISHATVENYMYSTDLNLPQISEFNNFRDSYWEKYKCEDEYKVEVKPTKFQYYVKLDINGMKVGINCLNTAWRCSGTKKDKDYLILGKSQITRQRDFLDDCELKFSIGHHDPNRMQEFENNDLKKVLAQNYDAYFCGHTHNTNMEYRRTQQDGCIYFTSSGTLSSNISEAEKYRNGFFHIDYDNVGGIAKVNEFHQDINEDFVITNSYETIIPESTLVRPMNVSLLKQGRNGEFISNKVIEKCISELKNENNKTIQFVALSSLGKTRILRETFKDSHKCPNFYYCAFAGKDEGVIYSVEEIYSRHKAQKGLIVLDNCPNELFKEIIRKRDSYASPFRLIGVNNDCYSDRNMGGLGVQLIVLKPDEMLDEVNKFIDGNIPISNGDMSARNNIKKIAGGFPGMAIRLVDNYKKEGDVNIHSVDDLMEKLLNFEKGHEEEQLKVLCTLSLFQPFPYGNEEAYKFIRENENITAIYKGHAEIRDIFHQTITRFRELLEICGSWLTVRPFPLAIWLVSKWFENVCEERMVDLVNDIQKLESPLQEIIRDGLCKRLEYMQDSPQAQELIQRLTIGDNAPFCNEKVICSDLGSQLFLAMSSVNPGPVTACLNKVLMPKQIDWIREHIQGNVRRNLVWALEKLCFSNESYNLAVQVLALLAAAENETWANNATGQLLQLFHIRLPGTEASLQQRMDTIRYLMNLGDSYQYITLECINSAFDNTSFYRDGSCSQFGIKTKEDYVPKSYKEIIEYWEYCKDILLEMLEMTPTILDKVAEIAVSHVIKWAIDGMLERMFPLLLKISVMKDNTWEEMHTTISRINSGKMKLYPQKFLDSFDEFHSKIRPNTFCQKLKDVRLAIYGNFNMSTKDTIEYEKKQYPPLAQEFVNCDIYASYREIKEIVLDKEYLDAQFSNTLVKIMDNEQLKVLLNIFLQLIAENGGNDFNSGFVFRICYVFKERKIINAFIQDVYHRGYHSLYVKLLSHCETASLLSYERITQDIKDGKLNESAISDYLQFVSPYDKNLTLIIKKCYEDYPNNVVPLVNFIIKYQYDEKILEDEGTLSIVRKTILEYPIENNPHNSNYSYIQYVENLLERYHDDLFAMELNKKLIDALNKKNISYGFGSLYGNLFKHYRDVIWDDFEFAFVDGAYSFFYFRVKDELGSGLGFGVGPLFLEDDGRVKTMCKKYPNKAPNRIATMIPIFDNHETQFSDWFIWLIDEYGEQKNVLRDLSINLESFSWIGSVIPLLEKKKTCFEKIKNHTISQVRIWVEESLKEIEIKLRREHDSETYDKLHYE